MQILFSKEKINLLNLYPVLLNFKGRSLCLLSTLNVFFPFEFYQLLKTMPHFSCNDIWKAIFAHSFYLLEFLIAFFFLLREQTYVFITISLLSFSFLIILSMYLGTFYFLKPI